MNGPFLSERDGIAGVIDDKVSAFVSQFGKEPKAILLGPNDYMDLIKQFGNMASGIDKFMGFDVFVKRTNGVDLVIGHDDALKCVISGLSPGPRAY